jgi:hypothetical protein
VPRARAHREGSRAEDGLRDLDGVGLKDVRVGREEIAEPLRVADDGDRPVRPYGSKWIAVLGGDLAEDRAGL